MIELSSNSANTIIPALTLKVYIQNIVDDYNNPSGKLYHLARHLGGKLEKNKKISVDNEELLALCRDSLTKKFEVFTHTGNPEEPGFAVIKGEGADRIFSQLEIPGIITTEGPNGKLYHIPHKVNMEKYFNDPVWLENAIIPSQALYLNNCAQIANYDIEPKDVTDMYNEKIKYKSHHTFAALGMTAPDLSRNIVNRKQWNRTAEILRNKKDPQAKYFDMMYGEPGDLNPTLPIREGGQQDHIIRDRYVRYIRGQIRGALINQGNIIIDQKHGNIAILGPIGIGAFSGQMDKGELKKIFESILLEEIRELKEKNLLPNLDKIIVSTEGGNPWSYNMDGITVEKTGHYHKIGAKVQNANDKPVLTGIAADPSSFLLNYNLTKMIYKEGSKEYKKQHGRTVNQSLDEKMGDIFSHNQTKNMLSGLYRSTPIVVDSRGNVVTNLKSVNNEQTPVLSKTKSITHSQFYDQSSRYTDDIDDEKVMSLGHNESQSTTLKKFTDTSAGSKKILKRLSDNYSPIIMGYMPSFTEELNAIRNDDFDGINSFMNEYFKVQKKIPRGDTYQYVLALKDPSLGAKCADLMLEKLKQIPGSQIFDTRTTFNNGLFGLYAEDGIISNLDLIKNYQEHSKSPVEKPTTLSRHKETHKESKRFYDNESLLNYGSSSDDDELMPKIRHVDNPSKLTHLSRFYDDETSKGFTHKKVTLTRHSEGQSAVPTTPQSFIQELNAIRNDDFDGINAFMNEYFKVQEKNPHGDTLQYVLVLKDPSLGKECADLMLEKLKQIPGSQIVDTKTTFNNGLVGLYTKDGVFGNFDLVKNYQEPSKSPVEKPTTSGQHKETYEKSKRFGDKQSSKEKKPLYKDNAQMLQVFWNTFDKNIKNSIKTGEQRNIGQFQLDDGTTYNLVIDKDSKGRFNVIMYDPDKNLGLQMGASTLDDGKIWASRIRTTDQGKIEVYDNILAARFTSSDGAAFPIFDSVNSHYLKVGRVTEVVKKAIDEKVVEKYSGSINNKTKKQSDSILEEPTHLSRHDDAYLKRFKDATSIIAQNDSTIKTALPAGIDDVAERLKDMNFDYNSSSDDDELLTTTTTNRFDDDKTSKGFTHKKGTPTRHNESQSAAPTTPQSFIQELNAIRNDDFDGINSFMNEYFKVQKKIPRGDTYQYVLALKDPSLGAKCADLMLEKLKQIPGSQIFDTRTTFNNGLFGLYAEDGIISNLDLIKNYQEPSKSTIPQATMAQRIVEEPSFKTLERFYDNKKPTMPKTSTTRHEDNNSDDSDLSDDELPTKPTHLSRFYDDETPQEFEHKKVTPTGHQDTTKTKQSSNSLSVDNEETQKQREISEILSGGRAIAAQPPTSFGLGTASRYNDSKGATRYTLLKYYKPNPSFYDKHFKGHQALPQGYPFVIAGPNGRMAINEKQLKDLVGKGYLTQQIQTANGNIVALKENELNTIIKNQTNKSHQMY